MRAAKSGVGEVGRAAGKNLVVGGLDVRVGADDERGEAVHGASESDFFRGRLGMKIDEDAGRLLLQFLDLGFDEEERIVDLRPHERAAEQVDDAEFLAVAADHDGAEAGRARRKIQGPEQARFRGEVGDDFALVPGVIAEGDDVGARRA